MGDMVSHVGVQVRLWRRYMRYRSSTFSAFSIRSLRALYSRALLVLRGAARAEPKPAKRNRLDFAHLSLLVDYCRLLERAILPASNHNYALF